MPKPGSPRAGSKSTESVSTSPALNVGPSARILVDGRPLAARERTRLFLFHKPRGLVTTERDPQDRPTIFSALPKDLPRVITIGRLDINTEGLLLLTNDGGLARILELPATGWLRRYRVRAKGTTDQAALDALSEGITLDGIDYAGIAATLDRVQGANVWLTMALQRGQELRGEARPRTPRPRGQPADPDSYGPFQLGELAEGAVEEVKTRVLRDQLGMTLAKEAGVDFVGPRRRPDRHLRGEGAAAGAGRGPISRREEPAGGRAPAVEPRRRRRKHLSIASAAGPSAATRRSRRRRAATGRSPVCASM